MTPTYYHQCYQWVIKPGRAKDCSSCKRRVPLPQPKPPAPKPRYTFEEAVDQIDICADCGDGIAEDHEYHHCEKCLPAWLDRIAKINAQQERGEGDWNVR